MIDVNILLNNLDGSESSEEIEAVRELRKLGDKSPILLLKQYRISKKWQARNSLVHTAIYFARTSKDAVQLGVEGLSDRSKVVRYRACMLLAYSLDKNFLPLLEKMEQEIKDVETSADLHAAIDAIKHQNTNFFADRDHSGMITMTFH